jgi:hypothetical protein
MRHQHNQKRQGHLVFLLKRGGAVPVNLVMVFVTKWNTPEIRRFLPGPGVPVHSDMMGIVWPWFVADHTGQG